MDRTQKPQSGSGGDTFKTATPCAHLPSQETRRGIPLPASWDRCGICHPVGTIPRTKQTHKTHTLPTKGSQIAPVSLCPFHLAGAIAGPGICLTPLDVWAQHADLLRAPHSSRNRRPQHPQRCLPRILPNHHAHSEVLGLSRRSLPQHRDTPSTGGWGD